MTTPPEPGSVRPGAETTRAPAGPPINRRRTRLLLDEPLLARIVDTVRVGNYLKTAAAYCGVGYSTLLLWQQKGRAQQERLQAGLPVEDGQELYLELVEQVTQAEASAQVAAVGSIRRAFADDWRAASHYLAVKAPEEWAKRSTVMVTDPDSEQRVTAAVDSAVAAVLHQGDGAGEYDPAHLSTADPDG